MGRVGSGILIAAVGAILAFAVTVDVAGIDIAVIGWILIIAGAAIAVWGIAVSASKDREVREVREGPTGESEVRTVQEDRRRDV